MLHMLHSIETSVKMSLFWWKVRVCNLWCQSISVCCSILYVVGALF